MHRTTARLTRHCLAPGPFTKEKEMKDCGGGSCSPGARTGALFRKACSCLRQGAIVDPLQCALRCTSCIDTSSSTHAAPTRRRPRGCPRAMHMPTQVRMHLRMATRLLKGLRFPAHSECFAVLGVPACGTTDLNAHTLCFAHTGHVPLSAARRFVRSTQNSFYELMNSNCNSSVI